MITATSAPAGADQVSEAIIAARAAIPTEAWDSVADLLPRTQAEATPRAFEETPAQQALVLPALCTQISNDVIVFTCEDEMDVVNNHAAAFELAYQAVEATNAILANCNDVLNDCAIEDLVANTANYTLGDLDTNQALDALAASIIPQGSDGFDETELRSVDLYPIGVEVRMPSGRILLPDPLGIARRYKCGYFTRPNPRRAVPFVDGPLQGSSPTQAGAARLARDWGRTQGFHDTPGAFGGGMTRPQTWNPLLCGFHTYRDHAVPDINQIITCSGPGGTPPCTYRARLRVQDYTAAPYGEPNPEIYRSGPWPYPEWPAYVYFWHRRY